MKTTRRRFSPRVPAIVAWSTFLIFWAIFGIVWSGVSLNMQYFSIPSQFGNVSIFAIVLDCLLIATAAIGYTSIVSTIPHKTRLVFAWGYLLMNGLVFILELIRLVLYMALHPTYRDQPGSNAIPVTCLFVIIGTIVLFPPFMLMTVGHIQHLRKVIAKQKEDRRIEELVLENQFAPKPIELGVVQPMEQLTIGTS
jgi:hypothetical protein